MKIIAHVIAILIGLIVGLAVRASMRPAPVQVTQDAPVSILSTTNRPGASEVKRILAMVGEGSLNAAEKTSVQNAILELPVNHYPEMTRQLLVNWKANQTALDALFSSWGAVAPMEALGMLDELPKPYRSRAKGFIIDAWVLTDADAAFAHINQGPRRRAEVISLTKDNRLWRTLTHADPHGALARAEQIERADERRQREDEIIGSLSHQDPQFALDWLNQHRDGSALQEALPTVLRGWAATEPRKAFDYLVSLDESVQSRDAFERFGRSLTLEVAAELRESVPDKYRNAFWGAYVGRHASMSPAEAAQLVESLPEGWSRQRALGSIASQWSLVDLQAASAWVASLPRSRSRDSAISSFALQLMQSDPEAGVSWFADMDHPSDRGPHLHNALLHWLRRDHAAATAWMDAQSTGVLSAKMKAEVLEAVPH